MSSYFLHLSYDLCGNKRGMLPPDAVHVELYADEPNGGNPVRIEMSRDRELVGAENGYIYKGQIAATHSPGDITVRIVPHHPGGAIPLEEAHILWQR